MSITIGIGKNLKITSSGGSGYTPVNNELTVYITGLATELSLDQLRRLDVLISAIKSAVGVSALSDFFDTFYVLAGETKESALRNLVKRSHDMTEHGTITFTQFEGFNGDGLTGYLNTHYNPNTQGVNFQQNSASVGVYCRTDLEINSYLGCNDATYHNLFALWLNSAGTDYTWMYLNSAGLSDRGVTTGSLGMFIFTRYLVNAQRCYRNGALLFAGNDLSAGVPSAEFYLGARNNNGALLQYEVRQYSMLFQSQKFDVATSQIADLTTAYEAYMDDLGKGVIP